MELEKRISDYKELLQKNTNSQEMANFFTYHKCFRQPEGSIIKSRVFKKLEEEFSKNLVVNYFSSYFHYHLENQTDPEKVKKLLWDTAQLSIAEYLCRNGKESTILQLLFTIIDQMTAKIPLENMEDSHLDGYFWNSYNRAIAYEDNSLFVSYATTDFFPSYLFNQRLGDREVTNRYLKLISYSSVKVEIKEKYMYKLQQMELLSNQDFHLQY